MSIFNKMAVRKPQTSTFDHSHDHRTTFNMGELVPSTALEVMPGDKFNISVQNLLRFQPLIAPVMQKINVTTHFFFVPNRLIWQNWGEWISNEGNHEAPYMNLTNIPIGKLGDYIGYPTGVEAGDYPLRVSPMKIAAYLKIWDEYYRDQNLQDEVFVPLVNGDNSSTYNPWTIANCQKRAWMHDYFTSCLPFAQKGDAVTIPLTLDQTIPVIANHTGPIEVPEVNPRFRRNNDGSLLPSTNSIVGTSSQINQSGSNDQPLYYDPQGSLTVDVNSEATDINTLRRAFRLQEWLEKNARGGTRYIEQILVHFGVKSSDARLQRPEFIGSAKQNMVISEVLTTAASETTEQGEQVVGNMAGHGISVGKSGNISYRAEEHGWIIGIINVQPITAYSQGVHKSDTRFDPLDYPFPTFAHIGEQEVLNKEIYAHNTANQNGTFGYVPRYTEMRYTNSRISGDMRGNLEYWTLARKFESLPTLNEEFIACTPRTDIFAVEDPDERKIIAHIIFDISCNRRLPKYGIPTL